MVEHCVCLTQMQTQVSRGHMGYIEESPQAQTPQGLMCWPESRLLRVMDVPADDVNRYRLAAVDIKAADPRSGGRASPMLTYTAVRPTPPPSLYPSPPLLGRYSSTLAGKKDTIVKDILDPAPIFFLLRSQLGV